MSKGIKCIICQSWDVVSADGYKIESRTCYVTNEDGTPHVYDTIKNARADIRGNYGRYPNANGFLRDVYTDEYSGKTTYSYISIIREDSDDYEYAMRRAEIMAEAKPASIDDATPEQIAATTEHAKKYADLAEQAAREVVEAETLADADAADNRAQMYATAASETAERYDASDEAKAHADRASNAMMQGLDALINRVKNGITAADVTAALDSDYAARLTREAIKKAGMNPDDLTDMIIQVTTDALHDASEARRMAEDAAVEENHEQAAAHAADARAAADRAEKIAKSADDSARTGNACSVAEHIAEIAAYARHEADSATETAEQSAAEAGAPDDIAHFCREQARRYSWTEEETAEEIAYYHDLRTANKAARALLDAYAEATGDYPAEDSDETRAAYKVARAEIVARGREASDEQRETVARMVQAIAERHDSTDADADPLAKYRGNPFMVMPDDAEYNDATPALPYQRAELLALLGDYADQYDIDAIEAEATEYHERTGKRYWIATDYALQQIIEAHELTPAEAIEEAAAACEAGNVNIWNEETAEYIAANLAPAGMADALVNAFCSNGTPQKVYDACIALADAYTGGEDTSAEEAALGVQVATGPFVKEWHMAVNIGGNVEDFTDTLAEDAANEACARETLRRRWNHRKERRFYLAPDTERIVDVYYNLI